MNRQVFLKTQCSFTQCMCVFLNIDVSIFFFLLWVKDGLVFGLICAPVALSVSVVLLGRSQAPWPLLGCLFYAFFKLGMGFLFFAP